jgi:hypothetical protein
VAHGALGPLCWGLPVLLCVAVGCGALVRSVLGSTEVGLGEEEESQGVCASPLITLSVCVQ